MDVFIFSYLIVDFSLATVEICSDSVPFMQHFRFF